MPVGFQVIDESRHPGSAALVVRPKGDVFINAFENRTAQFGAGSQLVNGVRPLAIERAVVFRHRVLAVAFLAHLDSHDRITALVDVRDFVGGIVGRAINDRDRNQRRMAHRQSAGEEIVHAVVFVVAAGDQIAGFVPGIDGRSAERTARILRRTGKCIAATGVAAHSPVAGSTPFARIDDRVRCRSSRPSSRPKAFGARSRRSCECPARRACQECWRIRHQNANESRRDRLIGKFQMHIAARAVGHCARWERLPDAIRPHVPIQRVVVADPVLHHISDGIGIDPLDMDRIHAAGPCPCRSRPIADAARRFRR